MRIIKRIEIVFIEILFHHRSTNCTGTLPCFELCMHIWKRHWLPNCHCLPLVSRRMNEYIWHPLSRRLVIPWQEMDRIMQAICFIENIRDLTGKNKNFLGGEYIAWKKQNCAINWNSRTQGIQSMQLEYGLLFS